MQRPLVYSNPDTRALSEHTAVDWQRSSNCLGDIRLVKYTSSGAYFQFLSMCCAPPSCRLKKHHVGAVCEGTVTLCLTHDCKHGQAYYSTESQKKPLLRCSGTIHIHRFVRETHADLFSYQRIQGRQRSPFAKLNKTHR